MSDSTAISSSDRPARDRSPVPGAGPDGPRAPASRRGGGGLRSPWLASLLLLLLLAAALVSACGDDEANLERAMSRGDAYAEEEAWDEAIIEYRKALQIDPNNGRAHHELGKAYVAAGKFREAYWELHEAARLDPENVEARLGYAEFAVAAKEFEEALPHVEAAIELEPENAIALALKGRVLEALERGPEAEEFYVAARDAKDGAEDYTLVLAGYYQRQDRLGEAVALVQEMIDANPSHQAYMALGRLTAPDRGRSEETSEAFRQALEAATDDSEREQAYRFLAASYFNAGDEEKSMATLREGIDALEDKLDLIYLLARLQRARGNTEAADALVEEATEAAPESPEPFLVLSAYRGRKGDVEGALEAAEKALEIDPASRSAKLRKAELLVDRGFRTGESTDVAQGRAIVEAVLSREPSDAAALFVRAKLEIAEGDLAQAQPALSSAIEGRPDWAQAHFVLGSTQLMTDDVAEARKALARALEIDPSLVEARKLLAQVHSQLGEYEYAIEEGNRYLRERPEDTAVRILVAQSLARLGKAEDAEALLASLEPGDHTAETHYARGRLLAARGEFEGAREALLQAAAARPDHPEVLRALLGVEARLGKGQESVARIRKAVEAEPKSAPLQVLLGVVELGAGRLDAAERAYRRAIDLDPDDLSGYEHLASLYGRTGRVDEMIATYERAVGSRPDSPRLNHVLGVLYEMSQQQEKAIAPYVAAIANDSEMAEARNNLAYLLAEEGRDLDRALDLAQEAKALLPESPRAADTLGWVLYKRGVPAAAVGYLEEAEATMDPTEASLGVIRHHLAQAYEANGEPAKAMATLERAVVTAESQMDAIRSQGGEPTTPDWLVEVRSMLERLQSAAG